MNGRIPPSKPTARPIHADPNSLATRAAEMDRDYLDSHPNIGDYTRAQLPGEFLATGQHVPAHWHVAVFRISDNTAAHVPHDPAEQVTL